MTDQDEQKLLAGLAALANRTEAPPTRMEGALLGAFRAEQRAKARRRNWIAYGAIAASVAMLISAAMLTRREPPVQLAALPKVETQMAEAVTAAPVPVQRPITAKSAVRSSPPKQPAVRERVEAQAGRLTPGSGEALDTIVAEDIKRYSTIVRERGIKAE